MAMIDSLGTTISPPLTHPYTTKTVVEIFLKHIFKLHGLPISIDSDWDGTFTSNFWQEFFTLQEVQMAMSTSYHPQNRWADRGIQ